MAILSASNALPSQLWHLTVDLLEGNYESWCRAGCPILSIPVSLALSHR